MNNINKYIKNLNNKYHILYVHNFVILVKKK